MIYFIPFAFSVLGFFIKSRGFVYFFIFLSLLLIYGFRHHIGTDWNNYLLIYQKYQFDQTYANPSTGYGFDLLARYFANSGLSIHFFNAVLFSVFVFGVLFYCWKIHSGYVVLSYLLGYLIPVIMVGVRQSVAIGFIFILAAIYKRSSSITTKSLLLFLAYGFHPSSVILFSALIMDLTRSVLARVLLMTPVFLIALYYGLQEDAYGYLLAEQITSTGALAHMALVVVPIIVYLQISNVSYVNFLGSLDSLQFAMVGVLIMSIGLFFLNSTAADRFSLYAYPLTAFCIGETLRLHRSKFLKIIYFVGGLSLFYLWYFFANNSITFHKYNNYFFLV